MTGRSLYRDNETEAFVASVNILTVEYLIKTDNKEEYDRRMNQIIELDGNDYERLFIRLNTNMHTSTLGAMITQGDYDEQVKILLNYLDDKFN